MRDNAILAREMLDPRLIYAVPLIMNHEGGRAPNDPVPLISEKPNEAGRDESDAEYTPKPSGH